MHVSRYLQQAPKPQNSEAPCLREHEAGAVTADLARNHGVSTATLYNCKAKYGGMDVPEAKRLRRFEDENVKLKKLMAEAILDAWNRSGRRTGIPSSMPLRGGSTSEHEGRCSIRRRERGSPSMLPQ